VLAGALAVVWAASAWFSGGFGDGAVGVIGITLTGLLGVAAFAAPDVFVRPRGARLAAALAMTGFLIWTCASIAWADVRSTALLGAEKTYVYVLGFLAMLLMRASARTVARVLAVYVAVLSVVAVAVVVEIVSRPGSAFAEGRLQAPAGYINASVALWMLGFWPAVQLVAVPTNRAFGRAGAAAAAATFLGLAVLGQSRAWLLVSLAVALLFLLLSPLRGRLAVALAIAGVTVAAAGHWLAAVFADSNGGAVTRSSTAAAAAALLLAAAAAAGAAYAWARLERRGVPGAAVLALRVVGAVGIAAVVAAGAARYGGDLAHPVRWGETQWRSFTQVELSPGGRIRFLAGLGSDRYPEWVIAWNAFRAHPVEGIGSENFEDVYLLHRHDSLHEPSFPHSIEIGLLSQLGVVGVALLVAALAAAFAIAVRSGGGEEGAAVAAAVVFAYWLAHGSFDWFWEFPALAGPALGFVGVIAASTTAPAPAPTRSPGRRGALVAGAVVAAVAFVVLAGTALASAYESSAAGVWQVDPKAAYDRLDTAASLDPLSGTAPLLSGSIALQLHDYGRAAASLRTATSRDPRNWYAWFQLALADAATRSWPAAQREITVARRLNPRDPVVLLADSRIGRRRPVSADTLNQLYENVARHRLGP
jgi:hypothetical protein